MFKMYAWLAAASRIFLNALNFSASLALAPMAHPLDQMTITIGSPPVLNGQQGRRVLAAFYCELLGMQVIREDWLKIATDPASVLHFALDGDGWSDQRPPRWRDPEHPQQMHLDLQAPSLDETGALIVGRGGALLEDFGEWRVYADPAGHPFCLDPGPGGPTGAAGVNRLVFDCLSPRSLASFYEGLLGVSGRPEDTPERVELALEDDRFPNFLFQYAVFVAARWPDPAYPAQFHVDYRFTGGAQAASERAERFGAMRLPKLADTEIFADPAGHPFCL